MRHTQDNISQPNVNSKNVISFWKQAKEEASVQLAETRVRAARLKAAIKLFTEKEKTGEPWPGSVPETSRNNVTESATQS